ncbi:AHH domain-containing protein, partial [Streptomyces sp. NPDC002845]
TVTISSTGTTTNSDQVCSIKDGNCAYNLGPSDPGTFGNILLGLIRNTAYTAGFVKGTFDTGCWGDRQAEGGCDYGEQFDAWAAEQGYDINSDAYLVPGALAAIFLHNQSGTPRNPRAKAPTTSSNAKILGDNLVASGVRRPAETAAHHIVASTSKKATPARQVLTKYNIDINTAANGVFLPKSTSAPNPNGRSVHSRIHTNEYFTYVNDMMSGARNRGEAIDVLNHISRQLQSGYWP